MVKKRRTKAQKLQAVSRRQEQLAAVFTKVTRPSGSAATKPLPVAVQPVKTTFRQRDLRTSLWVLAVMVGLQFMLWLAFHTTQIDEQLYRWIRL